MVERSGRPRQKILRASNWPTAAKNIARVAAFAEFSSRPGQNSKRADSCERNESAWKEGLNPALPQAAAFGCASRFGEDWLAGGQAVEFYTLYSCTAVLQACIQL